MNDSTLPDGPQPDPAVSRRGLLAGLGALGGGAVLAGAVPGIAAAQGPGSAGDSTGPTGPGTRATPITSTIASAPLTGIRYEYRNQFDFTPEGVASQRAWGGSGVYTANSSSLLWTSFDLPPGAIVHDVEWYVANSSASPVTGINRIWRAGTGSLTSSIGDTTVPTGGGIKAHRTVLSGSVNGPFPPGCRVSCALRTPVDGSVQVNGVRIGYRQGAAAVSLLTTPVRAYDSRSGAPFAPNETRTISLAGAIPAGAVGAVVSLSVTGTAGRGTLRLGAGGSTPTATAIQWSRTGDQVTTGANTALSAARTISVKSVGSTGDAHVIVDVVGYLS